MILTLLAITASSIVAPQVKFTSDSVYSKDNIIQFESIQRADSEETGLVDLQLSYVYKAGYEIYDDTSTDYIDGLKWDDQWISKTMYIEAVDFTKEHTLLIKTTYSNDYAGMIMAAKDGDWSLIMKNPETILKLVYYLLATASIIFGGFSLFRNKKFKAKTVEDVGNEIQSKLGGFEELINNKITTLVDEVFTPLLTQTEEKYDNIIKSLVLSKSKTTEDTLALIDTLKQSTNKEEIIKTAESLKAKILSEAEHKLKVVKSAKEEIKAIANDTVKQVVESKDTYDGTSI